MLAHNLPEPEYGLILPSSLTLLLAYPDERAGLMAAPAAEPGWRLIPCDPADPESLAAVLGYAAEAAAAVETPPQAPPQAPLTSPPTHPGAHLLPGGGPQPARRHPAWPSGRRPPLGQHLSLLLPQAPGERAARAAAPAAAARGATDS